MSQKIKNILFRMKMEGVGIVNFDGSDARWNVVKFDNPSSRGIYNSKNANIKIAKSIYNFTEKYDKEGNPIYKRSLKISSDCLRHAIFDNDNDVFNLKARSPLPSGGG